MAARYRKIDPRMWDDEKFIELPAGQKLIAVYVITAQSNRVGLFRFSHGMALEHLKLEPETFRKGFENVCKSLGWAFDGERRVVFIPTWWKYNTPENPNVLKSCLDDLHEVPQTPLIKQFAKQTAYLPSSFLETFKKGLGKQPRNQEQEQDKKQEQEKDKTPTESSGEPASANSPAPSDCCFPVFPTAGGKKSSDRTWTLPDALVAEWGSTFPGVDVPAECRRAHAWVKANLGRRKTAGGMQDFLFRWLGKAQNESGRQVVRAGANGATPAERKRSAVEQALAQRIAT